MRSYRVWNSVPPRLCCCSQQNRGPDAMEMNEVDVGDELLVDQAYFATEQLTCK
jgi:hypothetical protein